MPSLREEVGTEVRGACRHKKGRTRLGEMETLSGKWVGARAINHPGRSTGCKEKIQAS